MTNDNTKTTSREDEAILSASQSIFEITCRHRLYQRNGKHGNLFTIHAIEAAEKVLMPLKPSSPGANPVRTVAHLCSNLSLAKQAIQSAIEQAQQDKEKNWSRIRSLRLTQADIANLDQDSNIFRLFRATNNRDRMIRDLAKEDIVSKVANAASKLADYFSANWAGLSFCGADHP